MHLIVGATGIVGGRVTRRLRELGHDVRALVRGAAGRREAVDYRRSGIDVVSGDLEDRAAIARACAGVETIVCTATAMPHAAGDALQRVDHDGVLSLIDAAEHAGARRFVYLSFSGGIRTASPLASAKRSCERRLAESRMQSVILRPSYFMEVWLSPALGFDPGNARARIYGDGTARVSYISVSDVAEFAVAVATQPDPPAGILELGGPEALSQREAVLEFERSLGRRFDLDFVPLAALELQARSQDALQQTIAALMLSYALGDVVPDARNTAERLGVTLTRLGDYAERAGSLLAPAPLE